VFIPATTVAAGGLKEKFVVFNSDRRISHKLKKDKEHYM
jgi:hypothetical protein